MTDGRAAEKLACDHLQRHGLRLIAQNWACKRGELDLVMLEAKTVVFVEVRHRAYAKWGGALESVNTRKREKLIMAAQFFLQREKRWADYLCRFDVVAIEGKIDHQPRLEWLQNAFEAD